MTLEEIGASIRHGLRNVLRFSGREKRALFWPYAIFVTLLAYAAGTALALPMMFNAMARAMATIDPNDPAGGGGPTSETMEAMMAGILEDQATLQLGTAVIDTIAVALLAAAVARRLHDTGWRGWWGWLPVPFLIAGIVAMPLAIDIGMAKRQLSGGESLLYFSGMFFWVALVLLCLLLARAGEETSNRFGPPPPPDDLTA